MATSARILVVDDEESIRKVLATILKEEGFSVDTAKSGREAIEKSHSNFYNLALIDIRLPDMNGTKLLTAMKDTTPKMIKLIVTGYPSLQNAIEAVNKGASGYILKPFSVKNVIRKIRDYLKRQEEAKKYSQEKVAEFIETRAKELTAISPKKSR